MAPSTLFGGQKPADTNEQEEEDDDAVGKGGNSPPTYAAKGEEVQFKSTFGQAVQKSIFTRKFDKKVEKFHLKTPVTYKKKMDNGNLSIEFAEGKQKVYMVVFRTALKSLFQG